MARKREVIPPTKPLSQKLNWVSVF